MMFLKASQHEGTRGGTKNSERRRRPCMGKLLLLILALFVIAGGASERWPPPVNAGADALLPMPGRGLGHLSALLTFSPSPEVAEYMKFIDEGHASSSGPREPDFHMRNTTRVQRLELLSEIARRPTLRTQRIEPFYRWDKPGKPFYDDMRNTHRTQRIEPFYDDMRSQHSQNTHRTQRIEPFYDDMRNTHRTQRIEPFYDDMRNTHRTQRAATRVP